MARRPPTPPPPVDMPNLARAIEMMGTTLQQQSATMTTTLGRPSSIRNN